MILFIRAIHTPQEATQEPAPEQIYQAPGLDYSIQSRRDPSANVYNTHGMIGHLQTQNNVQRPGSAQNSVPYGYESTASPIGYGLFK